MTTAVLKTECVEAREARDLAIYNEWCAMISIEGQSKTRVTEYLMQKYGIHSQATIYVIRQRVAQRLANQNRRK